MKRKDISKEEESKKRQKTREEEPSFDASSFEEEPIDERYLNELFGEKNPPAPGEEELSGEKEEFVFEVESLDPDVLSKLNDPFLQELENQTQIPEQENVQETSGESVVSNFSTSSTSTTQSDTNVTSADELKLQQLVQDIADQQYRLSFLAQTINHLLAQKEEMMKQIASFQPYSGSELAVVKTILNVDLSQSSFNQTASDMNKNQIVKLQETITYLDQLIVSYNNEYSRTAAMRESMIREKISLQSSLLPTLGTLNSSLLFAQKKTSHF